MERTNEPGCLFERGKMGRQIQLYAGCTGSARAHKFRDSARWCCCLAFLECMRLESRARAAGKGTAQHARNHRLDSVERCLRQSRVLLQRSQSAQDSLRSLSGRCQSAQLWQGVLLQRIHCRLPASA
eukprot:295073-Chlamydomonas_euryale.AAC.5